LVVCLPLAAQQAAYIGAGGCASSNCHGGTTPAQESVSRILGTEYSIWAVSDKHAKAAQVLSNPRSKRMAEILGIQDPVTDRRCASCHVVGSPPSSLSDGVACEACHGAAEKWLGPHTQKNSHATSLGLGLAETKNPRKRAELCLSCHLGAKDRVVDHELIAAGHPDLAFELDTFGWAQPAHWREPKPEAGNTLPRVRLWAVGQAVALREGMKLLAERAAAKWPELAELECYQCHHDLRAESWRIQRGYPNRRPGAMQANLARTDVARILISVAAPEQKAAVEAALGRVEEAVQSRFAEGAAIAEAARAAAAEAERVVARLEAQDFSPAMARSLVEALTASVERVAGNGPHSAEQILMSLDALSAALTKNDRRVQQAMGEVYTYLEHPSVYNPRQFVTLFRKAAAQVN